MRVDMHQRPVNYKTAARSFCKQTCFSRSYFWDRKLSCKVASLQWASLVTQAQKTILQLHHTARGASTSSEELIAPATLQCAKQSHRPKKPKLKPKNILDISAKRYQAPSLSRKKLGNNSTSDKLTEVLDSKPIDPLPISESPHPTDTPKHTHPAHSGAGDQHGVPVVGYPPGTEHTSLPLQSEPASNDQCSHHGVPMVGLGPPFPQNGHQFRMPTRTTTSRVVRQKATVEHPQLVVKYTPQNDNGTLSHADIRQ